MSIAATGITAGYGAIEVLHGVGISAQPGEVVAVLGANGAGKSTLLGVLAGLVPARAGQVLHDGADITRLPAHRRTARGIALVPEGRRVFPRLTVAENLALGAWTASRVQARHGEERAYALFPVLAQRRTQHAGTLSGGEQQMLAIARALMPAPRVLLLDEPSMGVAPILASRILEVVAGLARDGLAVVLVEQDAHRALALAQRALVVESGRIVLEGPATGLAADPRVRAAYLGEDPAAHGGAT